MRRRLPPLNSIRAFEAVARHLSFKKAAEELCVTPAAVSQQIKVLEDHLGQLLFVRRKGRDLELTEAGRTSQSGLSTTFDQLAGIFGRVSEVTENDNVLTLLISPSLAIHWLAPHLEGFHAAHPEFELRVWTNFGDPDDVDERVDLAIYYVSEAFPRRHTEQLMDETVFPVCNPALLDEPYPLSRPADLKHHTLIHDDTLVSYRPPFPTWHDWLNAAGAADVDGSTGIRLQLSSAAVQAAIGRQGVCLARSAVAANALRAGRIVAPFDLRLASPFHYTLVGQMDAMQRPGVAALRDWLFTIAARTVV